MAFLDENGLAELWSLVVDRATQISSDHINYLWGYCWKRRDKVFELVEEHDTTLVVANDVSMTDTNVVYYADSYTRDENGQFVLVNPVNVAFTPTNASTKLAALKGKYTLYKAGTATSDVLYYCGDGMGINVTSNGMNRTVTLTDVTKTTTTLVTEGDWEFVLSLDRDAYPDSGLSDDKEYVFLGSPIRNSLAYYENNPDIVLDTDTMLVDHEYRLTLLELGLTE